MVWARRRRRGASVRLSPARSSARGLGHAGQCCRKRTGRLGVRPVASRPAMDLPRHLPRARTGHRRRAHPRSRLAADHAHLGRRRRRRAARGARRGAALNGADEALWPALPVGVLGAGLAGGRAPRRRRRGRPPGAGRCRRTERAGPERGHRDRGRSRPRGRRAQPGPASRSRWWPWSPSPGSRSPAAAGTSASTRACGSCASGVAAETGPRRGRRHASRDAAAGDRGGRAPTFAALLERGELIERLRLELPLGDAGRVLGDDDRGRARRATG